MQDNIPIMQYKTHVGVPNWSGSIHIWKRDADGKPTLSQGNPPLLPMAKFVKEHDEVISGLKNYTIILQNLSNGPNMPRYYSLVIDYWSVVIEKLGKPTITTSLTDTFENFWPKSQGSHQLYDAITSINQDSVRFIGFK